MKSLLMSIASAWVGNRGRSEPTGYVTDFDQGSAASITDAEQVTIDPVNHWSSKWFWWSTKRSFLGGVTPTFLLAKADHYFYASGMKLAAWATSADTDTWNQFDNITVGATNYELSNNTAFPAGAVYVASWEMYPFSRVTRRLDEWKLNSLVSSPASATDYIISSSTARSTDDGSGRTVPALPFYAFKVSSGAGTKNKAILTALNHCNETPGAYAFAAAIDWLLAGSTEANFLLDYFDFYCYPCLNPQGVWAGYYRSCPQDKTLDHNRQWETTGVLECIDAFKTAFTADTGGAIEVGIDFHHSYDGDAASYGSTLDNTDADHVAYATEVNALEAGFDMRQATTAGILHKLFVEGYSANLSVTFEQGGAATRTVANYKTSGQNAMKGLAALLADGRFTQNPGVGSREFNGTTDRIDWSAIQTLTGLPITVSAWVYIDDWTPTNQYILCVNSGAGAACIVFSILSNGNVSMARVGSSTLTRYSANSTVSATAWTHVLMTHNGTINDQTTIKCYINGVEPSYGGGSNGATETASSGAWSVGGRTADDTRNFDGKIAQVALWDRVLNSTEIANLAAGYAPDLAAPTDLSFYFKGNTSSLAAVVGGTGTADGTTQVTGVGNGPGIIYG